MSPSLNERRRAETMAQVSKRALELFAERGFQEVTMEDLARDAGISLRTLFRYFPSKLDLVLGPAEHVRQHLEATLAGAASLGEQEENIERGLGQLVKDADLVAQLARIHALLTEDAPLRAAAVVKIGLEEPTDEPDGHARMVSILVASTLRAAFLTWITSSDRDDPEALLSAYRQARELRAHILREDLAGPSIAKRT